MKNQVPKDPADLSIHPAVKHLPAWEDDDERFEAMLRDISDRGIDVPIIADSRGRVVDGRHRYRAARRLQLAEVDVAECADDEIPGIVLGSITQRRHYTKGALAYLTYPLMADAYEQSKARRLKNLKNVNVSRNCIEYRIEKSVEDFAGQQGFSQETFFQAQRVHQLFEQSDRAIAKWEAEHPDGKGVGRPQDYRAQFEPRILEGEIGLGAAIAGIRGKEETEGKAKGTSTQFELFEDGVYALEKRFKYWERFTEKEKFSARQTLRSFVAAMPQELRTEMAKAISKALKEG